MIYSLKKAVLTFLSFALIASVSAQNNSQIWTKVANSLSPQLNKVENDLPANKEIYHLNIAALRNVLVGAPLRGQSQGVSNVIIAFPVANGTTEQFRIMEAPVMHPDLAAKYPGINSYVGKGIDDPSATIRFSLSNEKGLSSMILSGTRNSQFIAPYSTDGSNYAVYERTNTENRQHIFECLTEDLPYEFKKNINSYSNKDANDQTLRTFRLAMSGTGEYTAYHGGTKAAALAAMNTTMTRVNGVYESDFAITMILIANNDDVIYTNAGSDPYTNNLNNELQSTLTSVITEANYDIGHLVHQENNSNGNAGCIGCICVDGQKGSAFTSHITPNGDDFDIDFVAHEMGHQFGGNHTHTHSGSSEGTGAQMEPGSGSTIMGYAGITGATSDVQAHSDDYFHFFNIQQITNYVGSTSCQTTTTLTNATPTAEAGNDYIIPKGTAFILEGAGSDTDNGDVLTFCWEQADVGFDASNGVTATSTTSPNFRSFPPTTSPNRYMPQLSTVVAGNLTDTWETVANVARTMNFALTVRDNVAGGGQNKIDQMVVTVNGTAGPFQVTSQATATSFNAFDNTTVTWNVAGTNTGAVNTPNVDIFLSIDGGFTYPITLATGTPNDGSESIELPNNATTNGRIMVRGAGNIFYALNGASLTITSPTFDYSLSPSASAVTICPPTDAVYTINTNSFGGYSDPITLTATGVPAGAIATFSPNPVTPGNSSTLTISNTGAAATGDFTITMEGNSTSGIKTSDLALIISDPTPNVVTLTSPTDAETGVLIPANFTWSAAVGAGILYDIDIASDTGFASIVDNSTGLTTNSYNSGALASGTQYFWRVKTYNACGSAAFSSTFSFETSSVISLPTGGSATTQTLCTGILFDSGGSNNSYGASEDAQITISPIGATTVDLNFVSFAIEEGSNNNCDYDYLEIYDGPTTAATLIARYCNDNAPTTVSSTGGSITLLFHSDNQVEEAGFEMTWQCNLSTVAPTANITADIDTTCQGVVNFRDASTNGPTEWRWFFGDGNTSNEQSPTYTYTANGTYTVSLVAINSYGFDSIAKTDFIVVEMPITPTTTGDSICANNTANLSASTTYGDLDWYDAANAGNLVYTGRNYTTPILSASTTYYVENVIAVPSFNMAKPDNSGGGGYFTGDQHLIFDVYNSMEIVSVEVVAQGAGDRTIELRDNNSSVLQSITVNIPDGTSRVTLNFTVDPGTDYQLGLAGNSTVNLYRNNSNVTYPYTLLGYGSVTRSSANQNGGLGYYYHFYNWEVKGLDCTSPRMPVIANVKNGNLSSSVTENTISISAFPATYQWLDCNTNYSFIDGETNQDYTPIVNGDYAAMVTENGCIDTTNCTNVVLLSIDGNTSISDVNIYPNPANHFISVHLTENKNIKKLTLLDVQGKIIYQTNDFTNATIKIDIANESQGIYILNIQTETEVKNYKVIKQ
jgi:PKD repeat protein